MAPVRKNQEQRHIEALAKQKGFELRDSGEPEKFELVRLATGAKRLNPFAVGEVSGDPRYFTLQHAKAWLLRR
jgi:hypothetical protein